MNQPRQRRPRRPAAGPRLGVLTRVSLALLAALGGLVGACTGKDAADAPPSGGSGAHTSSTAPETMPSAYESTASAAGATTTPDRTIGRENGSKSRYAASADRRIRRRRTQAGRHLRALGRDRVSRT